MLFYERVRLGVSSPYFFLDGVPSGVHLFVGPTSLNLPNNEITCKSPIHSATHHYAYY